MVEESKVADEVEFQGHTLHGSLDGTLKRGGVRTSSFQSSKEEAIELCLTGLTERFGNLLSCEAETSQPSSYGVTEVINDLLVFNVDAWPNNVKDLVAFGNDKIERLTNWFRMLIEKAGCNVALIPEEWLSLKVQVNSGFRDKDYESLWQTMLTKMPYKQDYQNVLHLVEILLVLPISAAQCERAVSAQNRIKSNLRVNLGSSTLEDLIRVSAEGPPVSEYDPMPTVDKWFTRNREAGERQRRPMFQRLSKLK